MKSTFFLILLLPVIAFGQQPKRLAAELVYKYDTVSKSYYFIDTTAYKYTTGAGDPFVVLPHTYDSAILSYFSPTPATFYIHKRYWQTFSGNNVTRYAEVLNSNGQQLSFYRSNYTYDTSGNQIYSADQMWDIGLQAWTISGETINTYDNNNNLTLSEWRANTGFIDTTRTRHYYTGKVLDSTEISKASLNWAIEQKLISKHLSTTETEYTRLVKSGTAWDSTTRQIQTFDTNRLLLKSVALSYYKIQGYWGETQTNYYEYDANGKKTKDSLMVTPTAPPMPISYQNVSKWEYTYTNIGQLTSQTFFKWKANTSQWIPDNRKLYTYEDIPAPIGISTIQPKLQQVMLYPNPAGETLHINGISYGHYTIFNAEGKIVDEGIHNGSINIEKLPTGKYLLLPDGESAAGFIKN